MIAATLALFFVWTYPANQATGNWSSVPENWEQFEIQWEYSTPSTLRSPSSRCCVRWARLYRTDLPRENDFSDGVRAGCIWRRIV